MITQWRAHGAILINTAARETDASRCGLAAGFRNQRKAETLHQVAGIAADALQQFDEFICDPCGAIFGIVISLGHAEVGA